MKSDSDKKLKDELDRLYARGLAVGYTQGYEDGKSGLEKRKEVKKFTKSINCFRKNTQPEEKYTIPFNPMQGYAGW